MKIHPITRDSGTFHEGVTAPGGVTPPAPFHVPVRTVPTTWTGSIRVGCSPLSAGGRATRIQPRRCCSPTGNGADPSYVEMSKLWTESAGSSRNVCFATMYAEPLISALVTA